MATGSASGHFPLKSLDFRSLALLGQLCLGLWHRAPPERRVNRLVEIIGFSPTSGQKNPLRKTTQDKGHMVDQTTPLAKLKAQAFPHSPDRHQIWNMSVRQPATA
jgi:hypothetical protein